MPKKTAESTETLRSGGKRGSSARGKDARLGVLQERALRVLSSRSGTREHKGETLFEEVTSEIKGIVRAALTPFNRPVTRTPPPPSSKKPASPPPPLSPEMVAAIERLRLEEHRRLSKLCLRVRKAQLEVAAKELAEMEAEYKAAMAEARKAALTPEQDAEVREWLATWSM